MVLIAMKGLFQLDKFTMTVLLRVILNQVHMGHMPGFLKLLWFACQYVCLYVSVSTPKGINNQWHDMV